MNSGPGRVRVPLAVIGTVAGTRSCGHSDTFKFLKGEPPEFAAKRRDKWNGRRCPACTEADNKRIRDEAVALRATKARSGWIGGGLPFRLPDGSVFAASYKADATIWEGSLTVPGNEPITARRQGIHGLFRLLGHEWLRASTKVTP